MIIRTNATPNPSTTARKAAGVFATLQAAQDATDTLRTQMYAAQNETTGNAILAGALEQALQQASHALTGAMLQIACDARIAPDDVNRADIISLFVPLHEGEIIDLQTRAMAFEDALFGY